MPWTAAQKSQVATRFGLTVAEVESLENTSGDSPEVKKWKDAFYAAAALWLDCETRLNTESENPGGMG